MNSYYVYYHHDDGEIVYIGHGYRDRAWCLQQNTRSREHISWADRQMETGKLPTDFVEIYMQGLTKSEACLREQEEIRRHKPLFNRPLGEKLLKVKGDVLVKAKELRASGLFYNQIAQELGISTMSIWRALNGRTKNV